MIILISDLDDTLTNTKHRVRLQTNLDKYFFVIGRDRKNKVGVDLYNSINADLRIIVSDRPLYWPYDKNIENPLLNGNTNKIWYITSYWLNYHKIQFDDILFHNPKISYKNKDKEKISQLINIINNIQNNHIIYLENDQQIANKIKKMFPVIEVHLVSNNGAQRL